MLTLAACASEVPAGDGDATVDLGSRRQRDLGPDLAPADTSPDAIGNDPDMLESDLDIAGDMPGDGTGADAPADDAVDEDAAPPDGWLDAPLDCDSARAALVEELYGEIGGCTITVRLDYETYEILGYTVSCAPYTAVTEAAARSTAQSNSGFGSTGTLLGGPSPDDFFVFYESPGDFGGAAAVSADTGLTTFGASIVWDGAGDISYPSSWRDPAELGRDCHPSGDILDYRGWDLRSGTALAEGLVQDAVAVVRETAVPGAFWWGGYVFHTVVLLYPRSVGAFDPASAEWIVMVAGGWLE